MISILPPTIVIIMGRRLPDEVVYRIRLRIKANKNVAAIIKAVKVSKKTIYKLQLNLNIWGEPYVLENKPATISRDETWGEPLGRNLTNQRTSTAG